MSQFLKKVILDEQEQRRTSPKADRDRAKQKAQDYARLIKDLHPPRVSSVKRQEMMALKEAIVNPRDVQKKPTFRFLKDKLEIGKPMSLLYLTYSR